MTEAGRLITAKEAERRGAGSGKILVLRGQSKINHDLAVWPGVADGGPRATSRPGATATANRRLRFRARRQGAPQPPVDGRAAR